MTRYQHAIEGLEQELAVFVAPEDPVKLAVLTLTNTSPTPRHVSVFGYVEWCLGPPRTGERRFVVTEVDETTGAILARNPYSTTSATVAGKRQLIASRCGTRASDLIHTRAIAPSSSGATGR